MINYTEKLEDTIWCNDCSIVSTNESFTSYGLGSRLNKPSIICPNEKDSLTIKNRKLKYPIAMLTIDEATLVGQGIYGYTKYSYLNINKHWCYLSPNFFAGSWARIFPITGAESTSNDHTNQTNECRSSISLVNKTKINGGQGSTTDPFKIF